MALKLKLKVPSSNATSGLPPSNDTGGSGLPKLRIKPPKMTNELHSPGSLSPVTKKNKHKPLKISLTSKKPVPESVPQVVPRAVPRVRIKPTRIPGEGYDSEAPEVEDDPY